jgi:DNA repair ATPase RecN
VPTRRQQSTIDDLIRQINKFVGVANSVMERYANVAEQVSGIQVQLLALEGALRDHFDEAGRRDNNLAKQVERLERLEILDRTGNAYSIDAQQIRKEIKTEHTDNVLRQELAQQIKNLEYVRLKMAKFGVNIPVDLINEAEAYTEQIDRIRKELNSG